MVSSRCVAGSSTGIRANLPNVASRRGDPPGTGAVWQKNFDGITDARRCGPSYNSGCYTDGALALLRQIQHSFGVWGGLAIAPGVWSRPFALYALQH